MKLEDIIEKLEMIKISNEELFSAVEFKKALQFLKDVEGIDELEAAEYILTPYYVEDGSICELYAYELKIEIVERKDFYKHLLDFTGRETISDVPKDIMEREKNYYMELLRGETLKIESIKRYIDYLLSSQELKEDIESVCREYKDENLYFELY